MADEIPDQIMSKDVLEEPKSDDDADSQVTYESQKQQDDTADDKSEKLVARGDRIRSESGEDSDESIADEDAEVHTDPSPPCEPCLSQDTAVRATTFCVQCGQLMCGDCLVDHSKFPALKEHTFTEPENAPPMYAATGLREASKMSYKDCPKHPGHKVQTFCRIHKELCCSVCRKTDHKCCSSELISKASNGYAESHGFTQVTHVLKTLKMDITTMLKNKHVKATSDTKSFSDKLKERCKEVAKSILLSHIDVMATRVENTINDNIRHSAEELTRMLEEIQRIQVCLDSSLDLEEELFVYATRQIPKLNRFENYIRTCNESLPTQWVVHVTSESEKVLSTFVSLKPTSTKALPIKRTFDTDCFITDIECLLDGRYVISDKSNKSLKLFKRNDEFLTKLSLPGKPLNVLEIEPGRIVVSMPEENKLQMFSVTDTFDDEGSIQCDDIPTGVAKWTGRMFVAFRNNLRIFYLDGKIVERISKNDKGEDLFRDITSIAINANTGRFYVVDEGYLFTKPVTAIREINTGRKESGYDMNMDNKEFKTSIAIDEDNSLYICTPGGIAHVTYDLVQLQVFEYNEFQTKVQSKNFLSEITEGSIQFGATVEQSTSSKQAQTKAKQHQVPFATGSKQPTQYKFGASSTSPGFASPFTGSGLFGQAQPVGGLSSATDHQSSFSFGAPAIGANPPKVSQTQDHKEKVEETKPFVFPKYCIGCQTSIGRLFVGGESDVLNIVQIG